LFAEVVSDMFAERAAPCVVVIAALLLAMNADQQSVNAFPTRSLLQSNGTTNCTTNYYGSTCSEFCHPNDKCNNLGICGSLGDCLCTAVTNYGRYCNLTLTLPTGVTQPPTLTFVPGTPVSQSLLAGTKFAWSIPAGALASGVTLTPSILDQNAFSTNSQSDLGQAAGYFLQLRPKGTVFLEPVTVTFAIDNSVEVPSGYTIKVFKLDDVTNLWAEVPGSSYNPVDGSVSVALSSFSIYGTFVVLDPESAVVEGNASSDNSIVYAIVLSVVLALLLVIGSMWSVAYFKNKKANTSPSAAAFNPATTAV
jgi:hypothetical protein